MILYSAVERVAVVVDGAPPNAYGHLGRLFIVEPGKATKVPYEAGRYILDHFPYTGVVRVDVVESEDGTKYDVEGAKKASAALLEAEDRRRFERFTAEAVDDYVKRGKPVPPPPLPILDIIKRRGYDLKRFGIVPIGWEEPQKDARLVEMEKQITMLRELLEEATKPKEKANARS
jgi:hypothetical protein